MLSNNDIRPQGQGHFSLEDFGAKDSLSALLDSYDCSATYWSDFSDSACAQTQASLQEFGRFVYSPSSNSLSPCSRGDGVHSPERSFQLLDFQSSEEPPALSSKVGEEASNLPSADTYPTPGEISGDGSKNYDSVVEWLNQQSCGGSSKRKRRITRPQRLQANMRERRRMVHLNSAFDQLRLHVPSFPYENKMSRIQTLKLTVEYITFMQEVLSTPDYLLNEQFGDCMIEHHG
ncbi:twist-related protein 2-like [Lingula anatina]|uniref:Twist-related protein 2-like n=1 Tax=Lingula anatina TaxID=7574 RepID=A0A1S3IKI7_LINAN|nr:twist-related protein 2-like [Lingula anatina]|eukprot:XP_013398034.1 twist-related protein 2-like [Lingula anatina]